jgi:hypothetical protein
MRRYFLVSLLALLGLFSIAVGVCRMTGHCARHDEFERHVADICVQAAQRANANNPNPTTKP